MVLEWYSRDLNGNLDPFSFFEMWPRIQLPSDRTLDPQWFNFQLKKGLEQWGLHLVGLTPWGQRRKSIEHAKQCWEPVNVHFSVAACKFGHTGTLVRCPDSQFGSNVRSGVHRPHLTCAEHVCVHHCVVPPYRNVVPFANRVYTVDELEWQVHFPA